MALTNDGTISLSANFVDGTNRPSNSEIVSISATTLQRWDINTRTQNGSNVTLTATTNQCICMVDTSSSFVWNTTNGTGELVELDSGFKQTYTGGTAVPTISKGQLSAGNTSTKIAISGSNTNSTINKFDGNTFSHSTNTIPWMTSEAVVSCLALDTGNFLVGTNRGLLAEVDSSFSVVRSIQLRQDNFIGNPDRDGSPSNTNYSITGISMYNNIVITTDIFTFLTCVHWPTGTILYKQLVGESASTTAGTSLCSSLSGTVPFAQNDVGAANNPFYELDFTETPPSFKSVLYSTTSAIRAVGMQANKAWFGRSGASTIHVATIIPSNKSDYVSSITDGTPKAGRIIRIIDDSSGAYVETDTTISAATESIRTSSGKSIIELAFYGEGLDEKGSVSSYNT